MGFYDDGERACCRRFRELREALAALTCLAMTPQEKNAGKLLAEFIDDADTDHMEPR